MKYRLWDKNKKSFIDNPFNFAVTFEGYIINFDSSGYDYVEHLELLRFTGLHDKNGKMIFEKDIVKVPGVFIGEYDKSICEVYCDSENGRWWLRDARGEDYENDCGAFGCSCIGKIEWSSVAIIGNMYENYFVEEDELL